MDIDIRAELEKYSWSRPKWSSDKLIAASPFRYDKSPSFFVRLESYGEYPAGTWADSGHYDSEWASGNFVKLLSFLRNETYEETEEYLLGEYGWQDESEDGNVKLIPNNLRIQRVRQSLRADILKRYTEDHSYLKNRGISEETQRQMGVLYDRDKKAAVLPWNGPNGQLANIMYRKIHGKVFWYEKNGQPLRELLYGIDMIQKYNVKRAVITEAPIDSLSWLTAGEWSLATGGASFNGWKRDLILRSPIETLVIATDNDKAGGKLRQEIETAMKGHVRVRHAYVCGGDISVAKDANEALVKYGVESLREAVEKSEGVRSLNFKVL